MFRRAQLLELGLSDNAIAREVRLGRLVRHGHGTYVAPLVDPTPAARWLQDVALHVAGCGAGAVAARRTATALWDLDRFDHLPRPLDVNLPSRTGARSGPAARRTGAARRAVALGPAVRVADIPITGCEQTLCELGGAPHASLDEVELALESALHQRLVSLDALRAVARTARRPGAAALRAVLARRPSGAAPTESYLETRMVQLLRRHGLPEPERQVDQFDRHGHIGRLDLVIGTVVIELDGRRHHDSDHAFHADRLRWSRLQACGFTVLVFTYDQVERDAATVAAIVRDSIRRAA